MGNDLVNFCVEPQKKKEQIDYDVSSDSLPRNVIKPKIKKSNNKSNPLLYSSIVSLYNVKSPFEDYDIIEHLCTGEHGKLYKVKNKSNNDIKVMKMISESQIINENSLKEEISLLKSLNKNENIINIYKLIYSYENNLYFIYDYYPLGNLMNYVIGNNFLLDESIVKILMFKIFNALSFLHSNKVIHGNLKMENILLYDENYNIKNSYIGYTKKNERYNDEEKDEICNIMPHRNLMLTSSVNLSSKYSLNYFDNLDAIKIKLVDFGLNKLFKNTNNNEYSEINHLLYRSPESLNGEYSMKSDIWSCGVIMYTLISGENPFINQVKINKITKDTITQDNLIQKIKSVKYSFNKKVFKSISYDAKDLIRKCLSYNQSERINIKDALNHKFFINDIKNSISTMSSMEIVNKEKSNKTDKTNSNSKNNDLDNEISTSNLNQSYKLSNKVNGKIMEDLINFCKQSPLFKFITNYIIHNCQLKIDLNEIKKLYMEIEGSLEDKISKEGFFNYLSDINYQFKEIVIFNFFDNIDYDKDGYIDLEEFSLLTVPIQEVINKDNLKVVYSLFEVNGKGFIYLSDVLYSDQIFEDNDFENKNELCNMFDNKDVIYLDEFCDVIIKHLDNIE